ncbi:addiction module protein [Chamaesiphon minutus]|uniref:Putative addiction module component, TIGR02574 family n=1 Tax=Chamaesiphon minutus (strain ATCC 27169 / PCC 6605) TaxID=1173020 RepID=K9UEI2_CHAP6|nr:addiction module protein [Chamaesiphon minutus]AFY92614.1 putative addiction module component, TIGR02574 family [Chamaesiphon minutus PCC 6605]
MSNHPLLKVEISQLSIAERIQLAEDLWDSILDRQDEIELDRAQQQELDRRLEQHRQDPNAGSSWETVKQRLGTSK